MKQSDKDELLSLRKRHRELKEKLNDVERDRLALLTLREESDFDAKYGPMYHWLIGVLYRHDDMGLCYNDVQQGAPYDEYKPEARTVLPRLIDLYQSNNVTKDEVQKVLYEEFAIWFNGHGPSFERFEGTALEIARFFAGESLTTNIDDWKMMNLLTVV